MTWMLLGLVLFLGAHSLRVFAEGWRSQQIGRLGEKTFKGIYAVVSLLGFVLLCWGYDQARATPTVLWVPPVATRHVAALLMLFASVLLVAANARHFGRGDGWRGVVRGVFVQSPRLVDGREPHGFVKFIFEELCHASDHSDVVAGLSA